MQPGRGRAGDAFAKEALVTATLREHALAAIAGLARRAMGAGRLRPGFVLDDT